MDDGSHGTEREARVRRIASDLGVADFVFTRPPMTKGGGASREISGDGLLIVGDASGAILQVKARDPKRAEADSPERAAHWISKNVAAAEAQGSGTRREITRRLQAGEVITLTPARVLGRLPVADQRLYDLVLASDVTAWPTIVVIDHPQAQGFHCSVTPSTFVITWDDWYELHRRLRSTFGLIEYVQRVLQDRVTVPLGHEADRYIALYQADLATDDGSATWITALPPPDSTGSITAELFRQVLDRVWEHDGVVRWTDPTQYRQIVEFLDRVPAHVQEEVGLKIIEYWRKVANNGKVQSGGILFNHTRYMQVMCSTTAHHDMEHHMAEVAALTLARHAELCENGAPQDVKTLGVGMLADDDAGMAYAFAYAEGVVDFPAAVRAAVEQRYGRYDIQARRVSPHRSGQPLPA